MVRKRSAMLLLGFVAGMASLTPRLVTADPTAEDRAAAELLFVDAGKLFREGKYEQACSKLADSQRLDPAAGTLMNLGRCYAKVGKTASAWLTFLDAALLAKRSNQDERERQARQAAADLEPTLSVVVVNVPSVVAAIAGLEIRRDGRLMPASLWNVRAPVDPGAHQIHVSAPGKVAWSTSVQVEPTRQVSVEVPVLTDAPASLPVGRPSGGTVDTKKAPLRAWKVVGLAAAGLGAVGLGLGVGFGASALTNRNKADATCGDGTCADSTAWQANERAFEHAALSTAFTIAGGVLLAGGLALVLVSPASVESTTPPASKRLAVEPTWSSSGAGIVLRGGW